MALNQTNLDSAWEDACVAFRQVAGIDLKTERPPTADDIRARFDAKKAKDAEEDRKVEKVKAIFRKTLTCIDRVGGIAAQGASMVFGSPASIANNALSFFINAGIAYRQLFDEIDRLLSKIVVVFERFQVYYDSQAVLPPQMIRVANKLLVAVVQICGSCYKTLKKNRIGKFFTLTLFGDDSGVNGHLAQLETLQAEESQMRGALNLVATQQVKQDIRSGFIVANTQLEHLTANVENMQSQYNDRENLKYLREALSIYDKSSSVNEYQRYVEKLSPESCGWIHTDSIYRSWLNADRQSGVLLVAGDEGCGKSYAIAAMMDELLKRYPQLQESANPVSLSYYHVFKAPSADESVTIREMVHNLAWQIARNDPLYRKQLVDICKNLPSSSPLDLWQKLLLGSSRDGVTFFLIIDGTHNLDAEGQQRLADLVQKLATGPKKSHCKLLLGARTAFAKKVASKFPSVATVKIAERNEKDISRYIGAMLNNMKNFGNRNDHTEELKEFISNGLSEAVHGSFVYASVLLHEIELTYDVQEAKVIVERAKNGETLFDKVRAVVDRYNQTLSGSEIQDLNTVLLWTMFGAEPLTVYELESIILFNSGRIPLKPLHDQIQDRFSDLFTFEYFDDDCPERSRVTLRSETFSEFFTGLDNGVQSLTSNAVTQREIRMIQNIMKNICDSEVYSELGLDSFFRQKLSKTVSLVKVDCVNAHSLISAACLRFMCDDIANWKGPGHRQYATRNILGHFRHLDADDGHLRSETEIGPLLIQLLSSPSSILAAMALPAYGYGPYRFHNWSFHDDLVRELVRLFRSSSIMRDVMAKPGDDRDWVASIRRSSVPEIDILLPIGKIMAQNLMTECEDIATEDAFIWLFGLFNKQQYIHDRKRHPRIRALVATETIEGLQDRTVRYMNEIPLETVHQIFDFAKILLNDESSKFETTRRLANVYAMCDHQDAAIEKFQECLSLRNDDAHLAAALADCYGTRANRGDLKDFEAAIKWFERAVEMENLSQRGSNETDDQSMQERFESSIIEWNLALERFDEVEKIYLQRLAEEAYPGTRRTRELAVDFMLLRCTQKRWPEVVAQMEDISSGALPSVELSPFLLSLVCGSLHYGSEPFFKVAEAFKQVGDIASLKQYCERALDNASKSENEEKWALFFSYELLKFYLGDLLFREPLNSQESDKAVQLWEEVVVRGESSDLIGSPGYRSAVRLGPIYIQRAVEAGSDSEESKDMLKSIKALGTRAKETYGDSSLSMTLVRSLICRYHVALDDIKNAKAVLKPDIEVGVKLLNDDDKNNDYQGFRKLGCALMDCGDDKNAVAAWRMIGPNQGLEKYTAERIKRISGNEDITPIRTSVLENNNGALKVAGQWEAIPEPSPDVKSSEMLPQKLRGPLLLFQCSTGCGHEWTFADDIWICRKCVDIYLCSCCYDRVQSPQENTGVCNLSHTFLHIPPWDPASIERIATNKILVGDSIIPIKQWLAKVASEWNIEI